MEQIKKYNYKDPLHQKGDPFGVTEAKVAHVNAVIDEVNSLTNSISGVADSVAGLDSRVRTLETPVFSIKGNIRTVPNNNTVFSIDIIENNTLIDNIGLQNALQFKPASPDGIYHLLINKSIAVEAEQDGQTISATIDSAIIKDFTIVDRWELSSIYGNDAQAFVGLAINPDYGNINAGGFIYLFTIYNKVIVSGATTRSAIPAIGGTSPIIEFNLTFSTLEVIEE